MERKEFLKKAALATLLLNTPSFASLFALGNPVNFFGADRHLTPGDIETISKALQQKTDNLFSWLKENQWLQFFNKLNTGINIDLQINKLIESIDDKKLNKLKTITGFEDFGGNKLIEPGCPALSLLYHILANPRVRPADFNATQFAQPHQLDILEDYIYGLKKWDSYKKDYQINGDDELVLAVFAYEYRTAFKTPHHQCADLVFSRTGIGRIGNKVARYDGVNRCYTNNPSDDANDKNMAVIPARYGLFVAKKTRVKDDLFSAMKMSKDKDADEFYIKELDDLEYLVPVRKLFNDDLLIEEIALKFTNHHENIKLVKLMNNDERYKRNSDSLLITQIINSSCLIHSLPGPDDKLIRPLTEPGSTTLTKFEAQADDNNRYFTAYFNGNGSAEVEDIEILDPDNRKRLPNNYKYPRQLPMYVNLSHKIENNKIVYLDRAGGKGNEAFENVIKTKREVPVFEDKICDGYVSAEISVSSKNMLAAVINKGVLNAFSIITAPDFFPQVDGFDLQEFDVAPGKSKTSLFYEGGIASLATSKVRPNPIVHQNDYAALGSINPKETYTAVVSNKYKKQPLLKFTNPLEDKGYIYSSYLPDICSSVFAPGWDITYAGEVDIAKGKKDIYLSTQGLGAPFVEDMKLCAAMNGMWPASSPDASRTYQGSVNNTNIEDWRRNPTAIPLMDAEIGFNKESPAVKELQQKASFGWDGEQGPFLEVIFENSSKNIVINFTDLGRADLVENALTGNLDMSQLRKLDSKELNIRMRCMKRCLDKLKQKYYPNGESDLWLVSAEKVNWDKAAIGVGIPFKLLDTNNNKWAVVANPQSGISGDGYLYVFASYYPDADPASINWVDEGNYTKRRRVYCKNIYVCQASQTKIAYYKINAESGNHTYSVTNWL